MAIGNFAFASTFQIDKAAVDQAAEVQITAIDLYIKARPDEVLNSTGITAPGIYVFIVETKYGKPYFENNVTYPAAFAGYWLISSSSDASIPTNFRFTTPVTVKTNTRYAFVVKPANGSQYDFWKNTQGEHLVGTNQISTGSAGQFNGDYFEYINLSGYGGEEINQSLFDQWQPVNGISVKHRIHAARYKVNDVDVESANLATEVAVIRPSRYGNKISYANNQFLIPSKAMEYVSFDQNLSTKEMYVGGQKAYQNTFSYPGGRRNGGSFITVATYSNSVITANTLNPNGAAFNWTQVFPSSNQERWLVIKNGDEVDVRRIDAFLSATQAQLNEPVTFSNATAQFLITPIATIDSFDKSSPFGVSESIMTLSSSTANSTVRFVNNSIEEWILVSGGSGYSNNDIAYVIGFENVAGEVLGGYKAIANVSTNSSGGIVAIYPSNNGAGFVNANNMALVIANSSSNNITANTSAGSGANIAFYVGATLKTELRANNNFRGIKVLNLPMSDVIPFFEIEKHTGSDYTLSLESRYRRKPSSNNSSGHAYFVSSTAQNALFELDLMRRNPLQSNDVPAFVSRSNEFFLPYANGALNDLYGVDTSNGISYKVQFSTNTDYTAVYFNTSPKAIFSKYLINNDYSNEHTDFGNAWAKGISKTINFGRPAEDLIVYLNAYRPANTDIKVYARIFNNHDSDAIDDKDWTLLEPRNNIYSSSSDRSNFVELTYGFRQYPNTGTPLVGSVTVANNSANLVGVGSTFTTDLANNDVVRIYPVLYPNTNIIAVINSVTNNTLVTINTPIVNNSFLGQTLAIEKVTYHHQAFNNIMNENVVRYYGSDYNEFDGYHKAQIKIVMLSSEPNKIPRIDDVRAVGTTA